MENFEHQRSVGIVLITLTTISIDKETFPELQRRYEDDLGFLSVSVGMLGADASNPS